VIDKNHILQLIKNSVTATAPDATLILYGSYARGDHSENSDIDLLILINKDKRSHADKDRVTYPLYDIEFKTGTIISPKVYTKVGWANHRVTPFYENVKREGRVL
jgi:predicted nucleotidyltransferase